MNWGQSYTATWRVFRVNRDTWADAEKLEDVDSVEISRTADGSLLESGSIEATGEFKTDYYRVVMTAEQSGEVIRTDVATLLFDSSSGNVSHGAKQEKADGYSVLYPASTTTNVVGEYAPAGVNGAKYAADLLASAINAPVELEGSFTLNEHVVHEIGSSVLEAVWDVLDAGGFVIQIDGRGVVHIRPKPTEPSLVLDNASLRLLSQDSIEYTSDSSEIPNRYIVLDGLSKTIAENNDPERITSSVNRGYFVDEVDTSPTPINGETYSEYANRKLEELSVIKEEYSYQREFAPDVLLYSIVKCSTRDIEGDFRVESQNINCDKGITVDEKVTRNIQV